MTPNRRGFLFGLSGLVCAPAVVKASSLMPISSIAPYMVTDPSSVGKLMAETTRVTGFKLCGAGPPATLPFKWERSTTSRRRDQEVVSLGNGYEIEYIRDEGDLLWRRGFLDADHYGQGELVVPSTCYTLALAGRGSSFEKAIEDGAAVLVQAKEREAGLRPFTVPSGLTRTRHSGARITQFAIPNSRIGAS